MDRAFISVLVIIGLIFCAGMWCGIEMECRRYKCPNKIIRLR